MSDYSRLVVAVFLTAAACYFWVVFATAMGWWN